MQKRVEELVLAAGFKKELWNSGYQYTVCESPRSA